MDCMEYMKQQKDKVFDLAIVDPPYGIHNKITANDRTKINAGNKFALMYDKKKWDKQRPDEVYWSELIRVSCNQIVCGGNYFAKYLPVSRGWIVWDKGGDGISSVNNELIYSSFDISIRTFSRCHGLDKGFMASSPTIHPTQKPVALYNWLLHNYAKPGQKILDTHLGSASSAIAAHYFKYDFIGIEIDKDYFEAAKKRFNNETRQIALF